MQIAAASERSTMSELSDLSYWQSSQLSGYGNNSHSEYKRLKKHGTAKTAQVREGLGGGDKGKQKRYF